MFADFNINIQFFFEFTFQPVASAFPEFETASGKLGIVSATDKFITYQYLIFFIDEYAVNPEIKRDFKKFMLSEPFFLDKEKRHQRADRQRKYYRNVECVWFILKRNRHIHSIDTGNKNRELKNDRNSGKSLQYKILIIGNNTCECVKRTTENICIYIRHFKRLRHVNDLVIQKLSFLICETQKICSFHFNQYQFIAS